jgi:DNA-binding IclR family transcriptional regulator
VLLELGQRLPGDARAAGPLGDWADSLATRTNEAVWVCVQSGDHVLVVHHAFRPEGAVQILEVGAVLPWHTCALGKAIVAHLPEADRIALLGAGDALPVLTGGTITDPAELATQLELVRTRGYAVEDGEAAIGDAGLAAPVFDREGDVVGSIGLVGPVERPARRRCPGRARGGGPGDRPDALPRAGRRPPIAAPALRRGVLTEAHQHGPGVLTEARRTSRPHS